MYHVVETLTLRSPFDLIVEDLILHAPTAAPFPRSRRLRLMPRR